MIELWVLLSFATWRVGNALYDEPGPWKLFIWLRERLGVLHDEDGMPVGYAKRAEPLECLWCLLSVAALSLTIPTIIQRGLSLWDMVLLWLASTGGAMVIEGAWMRRMRNG